MSLYIWPLLDEVQQMHMPLCCRRSAVGGQTVQINSCHWHGKVPLVCSAQLEQNKQRSACECVCPSMCTAKDEGAEILCIKGSIRTLSTAARLLLEKISGRWKTFCADLTFSNSIISSNNAE